MKDTHIEINCISILRNKHTITVSGNIRTGYFSTLDFIRTKVVKEFTIILASSDGDQLTEKVRTFLTIFISNNPEYKNMDIIQ